MTRQVLRRRTAAFLLLGSLAAACHAPSGDAQRAAPVRVARLAESGAPGFRALRASFQRANPGYDVEWLPATRGTTYENSHRVVFVQSDTPSAALYIERGCFPTTRALAIGDVVLLRPGWALESETEVDLLVFTCPESLPVDLPAFVRPDWDERITDTPGGCAEETGAYRRILLTWLPAVGPYVYHALNCHRVRIEDSFAHYHPLEGGFDELYLVQMTRPGAMLYTSRETARITEPETVLRAEALGLLEEHPLSAGDLVLLPRGTTHRGVGGALVQVITVPGFRPGAEIGVDHHLRRINERLGLTGDDALPFREASSGRAVVK